MISPLVRRVANHHKKSIVSRCVPATANSSLLLAQRTLSPIHSQPRLSQHQILTPLQVFRMVSNSANKNFSREHLFDCKGRVALVTGECTLHRQGNFALM
ncbi:hypothetical protein RRF57_002690 [Xylaria bambusicola]|uniref:Uncharacterized protein n=1 Tax=Xylaria bambusicola TaxID=326684 RepID=A0AAN7YVT7_9PEZI